MSKTNSVQEDETVLSPRSEVFKKFKRSRLLFEPILGVLGFLIAGVCVICCLIYFDYRAFPGRYVSSVQSEKFQWLRSNVTSDNDNQRKVDFLEERGKWCDIFDGEWVWDESYPLYQSKDCSFLDEGFRCDENGRPDKFYPKWRWQPKGCNLPRFDAKLMLEKLRNRRVVFVGDSIGRNQWESLLCLLSSAVQNKSLIYEVNGNPITKHNGFLVFKFRDFNCTVEYYRSPFLVSPSRAPPGSPEMVMTTIRLDVMDWNAVKWKNADVLVFNTGHWWNHEKTIRGGCYFQQGTEVKMEMKVEDAYKRSIETLLEWIQNEVDTNKTQVLFRTFAPVHFRGGDWRHGGSCHLETLPEMGTSLVPLETWSKLETVTNAVSSHNMVRKIELLNVTGMTAVRKDGHSSLYYLGPKTGPASIRRQDCSHWCLPGVPDSWNILLYTVFLKREAGLSRNEVDRRR